MYIDCPIDNRAPEVLFTRGGGLGACSPGKFFNFGPKNWRFLDFEQRSPITSALNVVSISKRIVNIASWRDGP